MVWGGLNLVRAQNLCQLLYLLARQTIYNATLTWILADEHYNLLVGIVVVAL